MRIVRGYRAYRLYDAGTAAAVFRETGRSTAIVFALVSLAIGGLLFGLHRETPFLADWAGACAGVAYLVDCAYPAYYDWLAGLIGLVAMGLVSALGWRLRRAPPPTVYCEGCDGAGWVRDLEPGGGGCPRCSHDRFTYFVHFVPTGQGFVGRRLVEPHKTGQELIGRWRGQKRFGRLWH